MDISRWSAVFYNQVNGITYIYHLTTHQLQLFEPVPVVIMDLVEKIELLINLNYFCRKSCRNI
jgi:hypothetical protein